MNTHNVQGIRLVRIDVLKEEYLEENNNIFDVKKFYNEIKEK